MPYEPADLLSLEQVIGLALADVDEDSREDLSQDVYARLIAAGDRIDRTTLDAYAYVVARNAVRTAERRAAAHQRAMQRLPRPGTEPGPDEDLDVDDASRTAIRCAWRELDDKDRAVLQARDLDGRSVHEAASDLRLKPGAIRIRTMRARDRLRVRFVIARRGISLPTTRCQRVLDSMATGDHRRQRQLEAGSHLLECRTCAALVEDVCERRHRPGWLIWLGATATAAWAMRALRTTPAIALGGATVAAVALLMVLSMSGGRQTVPSGAPAPTSSPPASSAPSVLSFPLTIDGTPLKPVATDMSALAGSTVTGSKATVLEVVGDEAFWVGSSNEERILVVVRAVESPQQVQAGQLASFAGLLVSHPDGYGRTVGVDNEEEAELLRRQRVHVEIESTALVLE